jgi:hypothetical protein
MADFPEANVDLKLHVNFGNAKMWKARVKGDGAGTTLVVPLGRIEGYWTQNIDDTSAIPRISHADSTLTYNSAPTNTKYHWLFVIGY